MAITLPQTISKKKKNHLSQVKIDRDMIFSMRNVYGRNLISNWFENKLLWKICILYLVTFVDSKTVMENVSRCEGTKMSLHMISHKGICHNLVEMQSFYQGNFSYHNQVLKDQGWLTRSLWSGPSWRFNWGWYDRESDQSFCCRKGSGYIIDICLFF